MVSSYSKIRLMEEILHQLIWWISHYLQGFIHPRWLAGFLNHQQYHIPHLHLQSFHPSNFMLPESPRNAAPRRRPWPNAVTLQRGALNCCPGGWGTIARWMGFFTKMADSEGGEIGGKGFQGGKWEEKSLWELQKMEVFFFFCEGGNG